MEFYGFNPPFFGGQQKVLSKQSGDRLIKNDILQLLLTSIGERVMRPNYGTILKASLFEPLDDALLNQLTSELQYAIDVGEPRIDAEVTITSDEDNSSLHVKIIGVRNNNDNSQFLLEIDLPVEST